MVAKNKTQQRARVSNTKSNKTVKGRPPKLVEFYGKERTIDEICDMCGITRATYYYYVGEGKPLVPLPQKIAKPQAKVKKHKAKVVVKPTPKAPEPIKAKAKPKVKTKKTETVKPRQFLVNPDAPKETPVFKLVPKPAIPEVKKSNAGRPPKKVFFYGKERSVDEICNMCGITRYEYNKIVDQGGTLRPLTEKLTTQELIIHHSRKREAFDEVQPPVPQPVKPEEPKVETPLPVASPAQTTLESRLVEVLNEKLPNFNLPLKEIMGFITPLQESNKILMERVESLDKKVDELERLILKISSPMVENKEVWEFTMLNDIEDLKSMCLMEGIDEKKAGNFLADGYSWEMTCKILRNNGKRISFQDSVVIEGKPFKTIDDACRVLKIPPDKFMKLLKLGHSPTKAYYTSRFVV